MCIVIIVNAMLIKQTDAYVHTVFFIVITLIDVTLIDN